MRFKNSHLSVNAIDFFLNLSLCLESSHLQYLQLKNAFISAGEVSDVLYKQITMCQTLF